MNYPVDSFETKGILVLKTGIEVAKKDPPKNSGKTPLPKGTTPKSAVKKTATNPALESNKEIIKKTDEIEISEEKKKTPEPKKNDN